MRSRMMEELIEALEGFRLQASTDDGYLPLDDIGRHMNKGGSRAALSRLTAGESQNSRYIDELVDAYATETGVDPLRIWDEATAAWRADPDGLTYQARRSTTRQALDELRYLAMKLETPNSPSAA